MAFGNREVARLIIQAEDQATPAVNRAAASLNQLRNASHHSSLRMLAWGNALSTVGRGLTIMGAGLGTVSFLAGRSAVAFEKSMGLVRTQADLTNKKFDQMTDRVLNLSGNTSRSLDEMGEGLYDIFSTVDSTAPQATRALDLLAKAAVAGNTDIRTTTRGALGILNAYGLSIDDLNKVLDNQFQLVRYGAGTYEEVASTIGMVTPSARAANQTLDSLSGALAYATRAGLSASEAGTAVGRALDLITRPEIRTKMLKVLGVDTVDKATGDFKQIDQIITEMATTGGLAKLTNFERKKVMEKIFGVGEIRANRFFNTAIPNFEKLDDITNRTADSSGAMSTAYEKMAKTFDEQWGVFINKLQRVGIILANEVLPVASDFLAWAGKMLRRFDDLSDGTKRWIAFAIPISAIVLTVVGALGMFAGSVLRLISVFKWAGFGAGPASVAGKMTSIASAAKSVPLPVLTTAMKFKLLIGRLGHFAAKAVVVEAAFDAVTSTIGLLTGNVGAYTGNLEKWLRRFNDLPVALGGLGGSFDALFEILDITQAVDKWNAGVGMIEKGAGKAGTSVTDTIRKLRELEEASGYDVPVALERIALGMHGVSDALRDQLAPAFARSATLTDKQSSKIVNLTKKINLHGGSLNKVETQYLGWFLANKDTNGAIEYLQGILQDTNQKVRQNTEATRGASDVTKEHSRHVEAAGRSASDAGEKFVIYGRKIGDIPKRVDTTAYVNTGPAMAALAALAERIRQVEGMFGGVNTESREGGSYQGSSSQGGGIQPPVNPRVVPSERTIDRVANERANAFTEGFARGLERTAPTVKRAAERTITRTVREAADKAKKASKRAVMSILMDIARGATQLQTKLDNTIQKLQQEGNKRMLANAKSFVDDLARLTKQIENMKQKVEDYTTTIKDSFAQAADIVSELGSVPVDAAGVTAFYTQQIGSLRTFSNLLRRMARQGFNSDLIQRLAAQGPAAIPLMQTLLEMGPRRINQYESTISRLGGSTARDVTGALFGREVRNLTNDFRNLSNHIRNIINISQRDGGGGNGGNNRDGGNRSDRVVIQNLNVNRRDADSVLREIDWALRVGA